MSEEAPAAAPAPAEAPAASEAVPVAPAEGGEAAAPIDAVEATPEVLAALRMGELPPELADRRAIVTVDGEEVEVSMAELFEGHMRHRGATKKFQEAATLRKEADAGKAEVQQVLQALRDDLPGTARALGLNFRQVAEQELARELEWEALPENERGKRQLESEREKLNRERQEFDDAKNERQVAAETQRFQEEYATRIPKALEAAGLTADAGSIERVAYHIQTALDDNWQLSPEDAAKTVAEEMSGRRSALRASLQEEIRGMSPEEVAEFLGPAVVKSQSEHRLSAAHAAQRAPASSNGAAPKAKGDKRMTWSEKFGS